MITEEFKQEIEKRAVLSIGLKEYLENAFNSDNEYLKGWKFLKENLNFKLKQILLKEEYWILNYNANKGEYILKEFGIKEDIKTLKENAQYWDLLGTFVYVWNDIKRDVEKLANNSKVEKDLIERGFKKINLIQEMENKSLCKYDTLKVIAYLEIDKIGLMGSFTTQEEREGRFIYDDSQNRLFFLPKGNRTRGKVIRNDIYYKEITTKNSDGKKNKNSCNSKIITNIDGETQKDL
jgi:hypothetical protein